MAVKQPPNLNSPEASVKAASAIVRPVKQSGERLSPFEDSTNKDSDGNKREGYSKHVAGTFGPESFEANLGDMYSYGGETSITSSSYGGYTEEDDERKQKDLEIIQATYRAADIASGGDGDPYTLTNSSYDDRYYDYLTHDDYNYGAYDYQPLQYNVSYNEYGDPQTSLDISDPRTREAAANAQIILDDEGNPSYLLTENSCAKLGGKTADMYLAAKASMDGQPLDLNDEKTRTMVADATIDQEMGLAMTGEMCVNRELTDKILLGKAQLNGTAPSNEELAALAPQQSRAPDAMFAKTDILGTLGTGPEQDPKFQKFMASNVGQGSDLFIATQAMQGNYKPLNKASLEATGTSPAGSMLADIDVPPPTPTALRPVTPAPAPAFTV